ncbi:ATP-binding protein [Paenibacillus cymbidii]|uniref:ATP-binding protein n=1 Tax=Paenibacillus cymbidii TaxID=1639034 RepID=UPI0014368296|nr:ATP-binding protein [Paenibacillus cymbidii]
MIDGNWKSGRTAAEEEAAARLLDENGYSHGWEHYADELSRLDTELELWLRRSRMWPEGPEVPYEPFNGLYVSDAEFAFLVRQRPAQMPIPAPAAAGQPGIAALAGKLEGLERRIAARLARSAGRGVFLPLPYAARLFRLGAFEERCVMLALAVELDRKYERLFGYMQDDLTRKYASVDSALQLFCRSEQEARSARAVFGAKGKLATYFLRRPEEGAPRADSLLAQPLQIDRRMVRFLLESGALDADMARYAQIHYPDAPLQELHVGHAQQRRLTGFIASHYAPSASAPRPLMLYLWGQSGAGKKLQVRHVCRRFGKPLLIVDLKRLQLEPQPLHELLDGAFREAQLLQATLCFERTESLLFEEESNEPEERRPPDERLQSERRLTAFIEGVERYGGLVFALADRYVKTVRKPKTHLFIDLELPIPDETERRALWLRYARDAAFAGDVDLAVMGSKFRFTPGQIAQALQLAQGLAGWNGQAGSAATAAGAATAEAAAALQAAASPQPAPIDSPTLHRACYAQVQHRLEKKATRIDPSYGWDDIVLPDEQKSQLRAAVNQIKLRSVVYGDWGFDRKLAYGKGLSMLFAGPPGTGKTMSAQVVASELQLEIYRIDLSQVISKYIGETEKNLHEIFTEAQLSNAILFFDETDALFGKRSEVKDSHDKYANVEIAYLLQKMEEYQGISVMATNLLQNIDEAFMRRISYIIRYPFPDAAYRERIWRGVFPQDAPLSSDVDYPLLAAKLEIAGGNIKNIAVSAAFLAADAGERIAMKHLFTAARHELQKTGKILLQSDFGEFH